jgi:hypothetical protein
MVNEQYATGFVVGATGDVGAGVATQGADMAAREIKRKKERRSSERRKTESLAGPLF